MPSSSRSPARRFPTWLATPARPRRPSGSSSDDTDLQLEIRDNGRGFDPATTPREGHFGLANMRDRAAALGGALLVESAAGGGTHIIVRIPVGGYEEARTVDG